MVIDHGAAVAAVAFSPDGTRLACGPLTNSPDGELRLIDLSSGTVSLTIPGIRAIGSIAFSPDGSQIISAEWTPPNRPISFWDATTGRQMYTYTDASAAAISPNGQLLVSHDTRLIQVRKMGGRTGETPEEMEWETPENSYLTSLKISPDSRYLATSSSPDSSLSGEPPTTPCMIQIWDVDAGTPLMTMNNEAAKVNDIAFSPDGRTLAAGSSDHKIRIYELETGTITLLFSGHSASVNSLEFSPDGQEVVSCANDRSVLLWHGASGEIIAAFTGHADWVTTVAFSPDGTRIASGSRDDTIRLWDVSVGRRSVAKGNHRFGLHQPGIMQRPTSTCLSLSPDDTTIASGKKWGGGIQLATIGTQELVTLPGESSCIAFSADNRWIAGGGCDIYLWDRTSGSSAAPLKGPGPAHFERASFSPDSAYVAAATDKGSLCIWLVASRTLIAMMKQRLALHNFTGLSFSLDGRRLASTDPERVVRVWDMTVLASSSTSTPPESSGLAVVEPSSHLGLPEHSATHANTQPLLIQHPELTLPKSHTLIPDYVEFSSNGSRIASYASGYGFSGREVYLWDPSQGTGERILHDPPMKLSAVAIAFQASDLASKTEADNELHQEIPVVVTLSKSGQLRCQLGGRERVWLLPSAISGDRDIEMTVKFLDTRKIRCALAPEKCNILVIDLQM